jgi:hypothetical protein
VIGLAILPESPRYLIAAGRDEAAQDALSWILRAPVESDLVGEHYAEIAASVHHVRSLGGTSYADCFSMMNRNRVRSWAGIGLQALQQLVGVNFIFYYGTTFFQNSGINDPFLITIATNVVSTSPASSLSRSPVNSSLLMQTSARLSPVSGSPTKPADARCS